MEYDHRSKLTYRRNAFYKYNGCLACTNANWIIMERYYNSEYEVDHKHIYDDFREKKFCTDGSTLYFSSSHHQSHCLSGGHVFIYTNRGEYG